MMRNKIFLLLLILTGCFLIGNPLYSQFKVIGYLPTWNGYPNSINNVDLDKITHLNIAFANPNASGDLIPSNGTLVQLATVVTTAHNSNVKVLMSIGGAGAPGATYTNLINSNLTTFVTKIVEFAVNNNLDGIDVDIEGDVLNGTTMTSTQYENFINALQPALHAENKLMTAALGTWFSHRVTNTAASKFDFINLMSYDAYGTWTGPGQHSSYDFAVNDLTHWSTVKNVPTSKLTVGVPFYGYYWGTSNYASTFAFITNNYAGSENRDMTHPPAGGILYYNGIPTIKQKTVLALEEAAGIMIWELTQDPKNQKSLLSAIHEVITDYPDNIPPSVSIVTPAGSSTYTEGDTIEIESIASDPDGTIIKTEYFAGTFKIGEQYGPPVIVPWSTAGPGTYPITVKVTDNTGMSTVSSPVSITVEATNSSLPFTGTPYTIPGKIEAENFNLGGNNVAYYDNTELNQGGAYRAGSVDMEICSDNGGGYHVGWTSPGEWLEYTVNITATDYYAFQTRVATENTGKTFHIEIDGENVTGSIQVPYTGGWHKWQTVTAHSIPLQQGIRKMRVVFDAGDFNINFVNTVVSTPTDLLDHIPAQTNLIYPNPVGQSSLLRFHLKASGQTKIALYDENGREVKVLANQFMPAGENKFSLTGSDLPKGFFVCKITGVQDHIGLKLIVD